MAHLCSFWMPWKRVFCFFFLSFFKADIGEEAVAPGDLKVGESMYGSANLRKWKWKPAERLKGSEPPAGFGVGGGGGGLETAKVVENQFKKQVEGVPVLAQGNESD